MRDQGRRSGNRF